MQHFKEVNTFVDGVKNYFNSLGAKHEDFRIGAPYLIDQDETLGLDFTGIISVSGDNSGYVFFSSSSVLLRYILMSHQEPANSEEYLEDLVGEVANTIAGNARRTLGQDFNISPPKVTKKDITKDMLSGISNSYVLPIFWKMRSARLVVSLAA